MAFGKQREIAFERKEVILSIVEFMNRNGLNIQEISKNTGLTETEVKELLLSDRK